MDTTVRIIINKTAGEITDDQLPEKLRQTMESRYGGAEITFAGKDTDISRLALKALDQGSRLIVAGGGDGTIRAVASALAGTGVVLGVLPLGTYNHFAKDLGITPDLDSALQVLADGRVMDVDAGEVNGRIFINNSVLGLYPSIVRLRESEEMQGKPEMLAILSAFLRSLVRYRLLTIRVTAEDHRFVRTTPIVFVGNNQYVLEGLSFGKRSCLTSGKLSLYIPHRHGRAGLLVLVLLALFGKKPGKGSFDIMLTEEIAIESRRRNLQVSLDGEVVSMASPLHYRIRPGALKVLVPQEKHEQCAQ